MNTIGELLRQWRHRRRLSQLELALAADVSPRHVSLVETGKSNPSADMVLRLAKQLGVRCASATGCCSPRASHLGTPSGRSTTTRCRRPGTRSRGSSARTSHIRRWSSIAGGTS
ncbi:helix-turn-helix transcriptional regulator [Nannocystis pusilla]|uniref:Helix-turn-helix transcriptional regulator n=1 Tax=Nannocystis pusilla TaxID=889268 RepID=A0A9X3F176_9BACT|nr:helix-turn-helix transcriptional regulator [Nannocystis pusilla]